MINLLLAIPGPFWIFLVCFLAVSLLLRSASLFGWTFGLWVIASMVFMFINPVSAPVRDQLAARATLVPLVEEHSEAVMQDRLKKPELSEAERSARLDEKFDAVKQATE